MLSKIVELRKGGYNVDQTCKKLNITQYRYYTMLKHCNVKISDIKLKPLEQLVKNPQRIPNYKKLFLREIKKKFKPVEKLSDIKTILKYQIGQKIMKSQVHIGQRKLFLSEVQFLTHNKIKYCVYAGASPGHKTHFLSQLFPDIKLILIDPNRFDIKLPNMKSHRSMSHPDIVHIYHGYKTKSNTYNHNKPPPEIHKKR